MQLVTSALVPRLEPEAQSRQCKCPRADDASVPEQAMQVPRCRAHPQAAPRALKGHVDSVETIGVHRGSG